MTPDTSKARKLIEEARDVIKRVGEQTVDVDLCTQVTRLDQALTLLPSWQEFDPEREETWPKEAGSDEEFLIWDSSNGFHTWGWIEHVWKMFGVQLYMRIQALPPPYQKDKP